jgi:phosphoserine phosphatase
MSPSETTVSPANGGSVRPSAHRANSSAYFYGRLKAISANNTSEAEQHQHEVVTADGKSVKITHSAQKYTIPSMAVPSNPGLGLVATLFYVGPRGGDGSAIEQDMEDWNFGAYVSDMAILEFIQTIESLTVPYKKISAHHKALDSSEQPKIVAIALAMPEMLDLTDLRRHEELWEFERKWNIEVVLQRNDVFRKYKRLAVFDMDSTLIQQEVIDEIAKYVGFEAEVSRITERAVNGEVDFTESLRLRCELLKGVPVEALEELKGVITLTPGAKELCTALKALGYKLAVLSGGFQPLADYVKEQLGLDYAFANNVPILL